MYRYIFLVFYESKKYFKGTLFSLKMRYLNKQGQQASSKSYNKMTKLHALTVFVILFDQLLAVDQLTAVRQSGEAFSELEESTPTFPPTFKVGSFTGFLRCILNWMRADVLRRKKSPIF